MIATRNVRFAYDTHTAFEFPDLICATGETLLVLGPSGAGKTTFLHLLGGLLPPRTGQITVQGADIAQMSGRTLDRFRGRHIGIVFQQPHFVAALTVLENLTLANWLATGQKGAEKAGVLLARLGIAELAGKLPARLSIGQQQRAAIARALMAGPKVLLADEPTSNLDDNNCRLVADLLREQAAESGCSLVVVTHDQRLKSLYRHHTELS
jgi:ABC-type lipoprotein export system ATPase subunit